MGPLSVIFKELNSSRKGVSARARSEREREKEIRVIKGVCV